KAWFGDDAAIVDLIDEVLPGNISQAVRQELQAKLTGKLTKVGSRNLGQAMLEDDLVLKVTGYTVKVHLQPNYDRGRYLRAAHAYQLSSRSSGLAKQFLPGRVREGGDN